MVRTVLKSKDISFFKTALSEMANDSKIKSILILSCEANKYTTEKIDHLLKSVDKPIFGGIFPQIISDDTKMTEGNIFIGLSHSVKSLVVDVPDLSSERDDLLYNFSQDIMKSNTIFIFTDGFTKNIGDFIEGVFNVFGLEKNYIGGGAGSLEALESTPCLYSNDGLLQEKGILIAFEMKSGLGVKHGWESISQPIQITESEANIIKTIDWEPAFNIYKEIVEEHSNKLFSDNDFFDIAKAYPFGMNKLNNEMVVRDPIMVNEKNEIICVGEVPQGSMVNILHGDKESLISAAKEASTLAKESFKGDDDKKALFLIDCISRVLFLDDQFQEELMAVYDKQYPLFGILSVGEIANTGRSFLEFYNKTTVAAFIED